jgi:hypothetical protein
MDEMMRLYIPTRKMIQVLHYTILMIEFRA